MYVHVHVCVHIYSVNYMYMYIYIVHRSYITLIGMHELHGQMHPQLRYCNNFVGCRLATLLANSQF